MPEQKTSVKLFENSRIRTAWDEAKEEWYFSVVDICAVLAETDRPRKYWSDLKSKLQLEGSELSEKIGQLKMQGLDGKMRLTDVANAEQLLRIIQSIPSRKAEPFKQWLASVGSQRLDETADPELAIQRALYAYKKKGYSDKKDPPGHEVKKRKITFDNDIKIAYNEGDKGNLDDVVVECDYRGQKKTH